MQTLVVACVLFLFESIEFMRFMLKLLVENAIDLSMCAVLVEQLWLHRMPMLTVGVLYLLKLVIFCFILEQLYYWLFLMVLKRKGNFGIID